VLPSPRSCIGRKPEASHEACNIIRNRSRYPPHCCNHHAVVAINSDRASCHRYSHRSLQEFPQPDRSKSFRTIALLTGGFEAAPQPHPLLREGPASPRRGFRFCQRSWSRLPSNARLMLARNEASRRSAFSRPAAIPDPLLYPARAVLRCFERGRRRDSGGWADGPCRPLRHPAVAAGPDSTPQVPARFDDAGF
jgi:hypothetical protein